MAIFERNPSIDKLIQYTGSGVSIATYPEIRDAMMKLMKGLYGNDIDLTSASADSQYINNLALVVNNILQLNDYVFKQINPATASGAYLDILAAYSNVHRILDNYSTVQLYVKRKSTASTITPAQLNFIDTNGNTWTWKNPKNADGTYTYTWTADSAYLVTDVTCDTIGPVIALGTGLTPDYSSSTRGDIDKMADAVEATNWIVYQKDNAYVGSNRETDESLRARLTLYSGASALTVLDGVRSTLLNISGVEDCYIFNNNTGIAKTMTDGTSIANHDIYIVLRYDEGTAITNATIGQAIDFKLTPGVCTTNTSVAVSQKSYTVIKGTIINYTIYWKKAAPTAVAGTITALYNDSYELPTTLTSHAATTTMEKKIEASIKEYADSIKIDEDLSISQLQYVVQAQALKNNLPTFYVSTANITGASNGKKSSNLNYFKVTSVNFAYSSGTMTITLA